MYPHIYINPAYCLFAYTQVGGNFCSLTYFFSFLSDKQAVSANICVLIITVTEEKMPLWVSYWYKEDLSKLALFIQL